MVILMAYHGIFYGDLSNKHAGFYWDFMGLFMGILWDVPANIWEKHGYIMEYSWDIVKTIAGIRMGFG